MPSVSAGSIKRQGVFLILPAPLDWTLIHWRVTQGCIKLGGTHLYTWVERGNVRVVSGVAQNTQHNDPSSGSNPD